MGPPSMVGQGSTLWAFSLSVSDEDRVSVWGSYSLFAVVQVASGLNSVIAAAIRAELGPRSF